MTQIDGWDAEQSGWLQRPLQPMRSKASAADGNTPKQLQYGTGGPKQVENLYTRTMLEEAFGGFRDLEIVEEEREMRGEWVARETQRGGGAPPRAGTMK